MSNEFINNENCFSERENQNKVINKIYKSFEYYA